MTDTMERIREVVDAISADRAVPRRRVGTPRDPAGNCTNDTHGITRGAYDRGCRCPAARAGRDAYVAARRVRMPAQVDTDGNCTAARHDSDGAYLMAGCRCAVSIRRHAEVQLRANERNARRRERDQAKAIKADLQPGRFRGPNMRVDRTSLLMLLSGFVDSPTAGERIAAVAILSQRGHRTGLYDNTEIGQRIGVDRDSVRRIKARIKQLATLRTERRLADAKWKAVRVARARARRSGTVAD
jgi:hypothetical protein